MKTNIIISINPEHVKKILEGVKQYEYRKNAPKQVISSIIIYETTPMKRIVAEAEILEILEIIKCSPEELWTETKDASGISKQFFDQYFHGRDVAYAYKLGTVNVFDTPKSLAEYGIKTPPQSFVYV